MKNMVGKEKTLVCFLGEKHFYTTRHQISIKHIPTGTHIPEGINHVKRPRVLSYRFPIKVVFMGGRRSNAR